MLNLSRLKKQLAAMTAVLLFLSTLPAAVSAESMYEPPTDLNLAASSAILLSLGAAPSEDAVLYELQADAKKSPAALVRLMVGVTAIEIIREKGLDIDKVTGKYSSAGFNLIAGSGLSTVQMQVGEEWTVRDLLSISMVQTAADACVTLAITLAGSHDAFVAKMNDLAAKIGCENTTFSNATGIDTVTQYTTARDLCKIIRYGMDYPEFEPLFAATEYTVKPVSGGEERSFPNKNDMLRSTSSFYYKPMAFGKTGFTDNSGRCLASVARDSGYEYMCVVLGEPDVDADGNTGRYFKDTRALYKWAFTSFTYQTLLDKNQPITQIPVKLAWNKESVTLVPEKALSATVINGLDVATISKKITAVKSVDAPVKKGQVLGKVELIFKTDQKLGEVNLVAAESVERSEILLVWSQIQSFLTSPWFYAGLVLLALLLIGYVILNIVHNRNRRRNRMKKISKFR